MLMTLANLGLVVFMFIVGLELNLGLIRGNERRAGAVSLASVAFPFVLGLALASALFSAHRTGATFLAFALFVGASMSVTAFPVLARILTERGMHRTPLGVLALAAAAVDDVLAWSLLAAVTAVAEHSDQGRLMVTVGASLAFVAGMLLIVRPLLRRVTDRYRRAGRLTPDLLAVLVGLLLSAYATEKIGIHFIFGAFLFGAAMPREGTAPLFAEILERLEQVSVLLLLPLFFVTTGFTVDLRRMGLSGLGELALILLVACAGKFLGASIAARAQGLPGRTSAALGILMNTRGLTELVILRIGLDKNVLDGDLFALLVVMAVVTTMITEPLLRVVYPDRLVARDVAAAERGRLGQAAYRVVVAVDDPSRAARLAGPAAALVRGRGPAEVLLSHLRPAPRAPVEVGSGLVGELADIAAALDALNTVAAGLRRQGVEPLVLARSSIDVAGDLLAQIDTVDADVVVVDADADRGLVGRLFAGAPCTVLVARSSRRPRSGRSVRPPGRRRPPRRGGR